jgi:hypothetical protein
MSDYLSTLVGKYRQKGIFVDSEILLLFIVGSKSPGLIKNIGRTAKFNENDFILVSEFIENFDLKITSPHVLTEVSDLLKKDEDLHIILKTYINLAVEKFLTSKEIAESASFRKFGLADSAIIESSKNKYLIFTADNPFYGYLINQGIDSVNFDSLKAAF